MREGIENISSEQEKANLTSAFFLTMLYLNGNKVHLTCKELDDAKRDRIGKQMLIEPTPHGINVFLV